MRLILIDPPVNEPLTAAEAKARLNLGDEISDAVVDSYLLAARQRIDGADGYLGRALITQTWICNLDCFPTCNGNRIYIPLPPLQEVTEISYLDADGLPVVIAEGDYQIVQGPRPYVVPAYGLAWPTVTYRADAITITFVAGYGDDGDNVPEPIRTAIALAAGQMSSMTTRSSSVTEEVTEGVGSTRYAVNNSSKENTDYVIGNLLSTYQVMWV